MKFGKLIEYNMRNIVLEKYSKYGAKTSLRPFPKKSKFSIYLYKQFAVLYIENILKLEILGNICIVIICFPVGDVINFEINLGFFIKLFSCIIIKVRKEI